MPVVAPFSPVRVPVLPGAQQHEVVGSVVPLVVVLVVHVHPVRDGSDFLHVYPSVQKPPAAVAVVRVPLARVPAHPVVLDVVGHVNTVPVDGTRDASVQPWSVATLWSGVSQVDPAAWPYLRTSLVPLSQTLSTRRNPLRVQTQSPGRRVSMGRSPSAVRTRVPSAAQRLPPERRRSVSASVFAPNNFASLPLGHRTTVPPGTVTIFASGE